MVVLTLRDIWLTFLAVNSATMRAARIRYLEEELNMLIMRRDLAQANGDFKRAYETCAFIDKTAHQLTEELDHGEPTRQ